MKSKKPMITRELIEYAYRLFYGREPEDDAAVLHHQRVKDFEELRSNFLYSDEFFFNHCKHLARRLFRQIMYAKKLDIDVDVNQETLDVMIPHIIEVWTKYGQNEPYWSVLTAQDYTLENIPGNMERFSDSGKEEVEGLEAILLRNDVDPDSIDTCLEYGCGVGRVTRWLALRFGHVFAFDISRPHLRIAQEYLNRNGLKNVDFIQVQSLAEIDTPRNIDLVYSTLVLQHNPPPIIVCAIKKLLNLLDTQGVAVFQVPTYVKNYRFVAKEYMEQMHLNHEMEFHVLPQRKVFKIAEETGCSVLEVLPYPATDDIDYVSNLFILQKR